MIEVGPVGNSYGYRVSIEYEGDQGWLYSAHPYANAASARWAAHQPQRLIFGKGIEPVPGWNDELHGAHQEVPR